MDKETIEYIGDGVYCTIDGYGDLIITTAHHNPKLADNVIYIDKEYFINLIKFIEANLYKNAIKFESKEI